MVVYHIWGFFSICLDATIILCYGCAMETAILGIIFCAGLFLLSALCEGQSQNVKIVTTLAYMVILPVCFGLVLRLL
jgi:hypothetical protein